MKTHFALSIAIVGVLLLNSCGALKPLSSVQGEKVQTTFFGASFGDKDEFYVTDRMSRNGIGYGWRAINRESRIIPNVSFAGKDWYAAFIQFTDHQFSGISFTNRFDDEEDAVEELNEIRGLLGKKYDLRKETLGGKYKHFYVYTDAIGNTVYAVVTKMNDMESRPWICGISYSWYKAPQIAEQKTMNEI